MIGAQTRNLTYSPQENSNTCRTGVLAEPSLSSQHSTGWIGQDKGQDIRLQDRSNAKASYPYSQLMWE